MERSRQTGKYLFNQSKARSRTLMARPSLVSLSRSLSDDQRERPGGACMQGDLYFPWYRYLQVCLALCILSPVFQWITHLSYSQALTHTACQAHADAMRRQICPCFDEAHMRLTANRMLDRPSFLRRVDCSSTPRVRAALRLHIAALQCTIQPRRLTHIE